MPIPTSESRLGLDVMLGPRYTASHRWQRSHHLADLTETHSRMPEEQERVYFEKTSRFQSCHKSFMTILFSFAEGGNHKRLLLQELRLTDKPHGCCLGSSKC